MGKVVNWLWMDYRGTLNFSSSDNPSTSGSSNKIYVVIDLSGVGLLRGQRQYVSAGDNTTVCLQTKKGIGADVKELDSTDPRFFILKPAGAGHNCFESTERPDCFLAYNGSQIYLKHIPSATNSMLANDAEVVFKIWPCGANIS